MLRTLSSGDADTLREFFRTAGYTAEEFERRRVLLDFPLRRNLPVLLESTREPSLLNLLLRWFLLDVPAASESAAALVPDHAMRLLLESGIIHQDGEWLPPGITLTPLDGYLFAADTAARLESRAPDMVIWPNPTSLILNQFTMRHTTEATLDLGSGCGIQALFAARHSSRVTATDLNARAAQFIRFNAWLNGIANIESLTGDTFEPVRNRTFDLIVTNPPFFVTPTADQLYCQNEMELDQYCRRVAREGCGYLNNGGYLQMICEWAQVRGQPWRERLREWVEGTGCDSVIFRTYSCEAAAYAVKRMPQTAAGSGEETMEKWLDYYRKLGIEQIHGGLIAMRRRAGRNWVHFEEMPVNPNQAFGDAVRQTFGCIDLLGSDPSDGGLMEAQLRVSPDARIDQELQQADGRWQTVNMTLRVTGIPASMRLDAPVAEFLAGLDGQRTVGELVEKTVLRVRADPERVRRECLAVLRRLVERRFVVPAGGQQRGMTAPLD